MVIIDNLWQWPSQNSRRRKIQVSVILRSMVTSVDGFGNTKQDVTIID